VLSLMQVSEAHLDAGHNGIQFVLGHVHELAGALVRRCKAQQVQRRQPRLPSAAESQQMKC